MQELIKMTEKTSLLVMPAGLPSSGKSTICRYLETEFDLLRLGPEEERSRIYGIKNFDEFKKRFGENYKSEDQKVIKSVEIKRDLALKEGKNVVIDVFAATYYTRRDWFAENGFYRHKPESNFLVYIISNSEVLAQREIERKRDSEAIKKFISASRWSTPGLNEPLYTFLHYTNDSKEDLDFIMQQLPKDLGLK